MNAQAEFADGVWNNVMLLFFFLSICISLALA